MIILKMCVMISCGIIAYQDVRDRMVVWTLFPLTALLFSLLHLYHSSWNQFAVFATINILLVTAILLILFLYTKNVQKRKFLNYSFGLGDLLFFYAFALGFPTVTFILLFVGAIFFSLAVYFLLKSKHATETVPLAGLMGLFLICAFTVSLFPNMPSLFLI